MLLLPHDKGTALVLALVISGGLLLGAAGRTRTADVHGGALTAGLALALLGLFVASAPGLAGEDGVPVVAGLAAGIACVAAPVVGARTGLRAAPLVGAGVLATAVLLVAIAPADTSGFLSGDPPHTGERAFVVLGAGLLCLWSGVGAALAWRHAVPPAVAVAAAIFVAGALAHGYTLLAPFV